MSPHAGASWFVNVRIGVLRCAAQANKARSMGTENRKFARRNIDLVARFSQNDGYRCLSLTRALGVVKCQLALVW